MAFVLHPPTAVQWPWIVLLAYWLYGSFHTRQTRKADSRFSMMLVRLLIAGAIVFLFSSPVEQTVLAARFVPRSHTLREIGIGISWLGVALAIWARYELGEFWSARVTIKVDHELIDSGPYVLMRHPIYSGILLGMVGTALAIGQWRAIVIIALLATLYFAKARREESLLSEEFGPRFEEYRKTRGFILPRFH